ncbi:AraC family transcriptional regulator [Neorhizobium sp. NCHU2750]|uniref:helix-turn-helix domain-containing protein n=1 Tax=Neorhizobium sp. NCHU2750 TaxID=1825976 RepID=UPI0013C46DC1
MLSIPLPFIAGLVFVLVIHHSLKGVEARGSRRYFLAFLVLYALQGMIVGIHFGYGVAALAPVQPVTASIMPPLAYLAFRGLTDVDVPKPWHHFWPPVLMILAIFLLPVLIDPLLLVIFLAYGVALWRLTRTDGEEMMTQASLQRMRPAFRAARLTAALMFLFAASDAGIAIYAVFRGTAIVPSVVAIINLLALAASLLFSMAPVVPDASRTIGKRAAASNPQDEAIVGRVLAALEDGNLYRDENLSLARIARKAGIPARDLSSAINRSAGLNVSQFVNNRRIAEACRLLEETGKSATSIMLEAGFSTKSNFNREFRRVTGMSPRQWRAKIRKERGAKSANS